MSIRRLYVIDTSALISFYRSIFAHAIRYNGSPCLSNRTSEIIQEAIYAGGSDIRISIPSVVFVEIYEKWLDCEEFSRMFFYEIYIPLKRSVNIEIRSIDREVLENLLRIDGKLSNHDLHDRLVLASAMALGAPLITTDDVLTAYVNEKKVVPKVFR